MVLYESFKRRIRRDLLFRRKKRWCLGSAAFRFGPTNAARIFMVSPSSAHYWKKKVLDFWYHSNSHGGRRHIPFVRQEAYIHALVKQVNLMRPTSTIAYYRRAIYMTLNIRVSSSYLRSLFVKWRWSYVRSQTLPPNCSMFI